MANNKSAEKRIRQSEARRLHNRYYAKTARTFVKRLRNEKDKAAAVDLLSKVFAMLDKLAKTRIIHRNKAGNLKSSLSLHVNSLS